MADATDLTTLLVAIANLDHHTAVDLLTATPSLASARLARRDEFFLTERLAQVYEGDTALHAAGFSYDPEMARDLITRGADIRAGNRRGAEPLHAAVIGVPGSASWNPTRQRDVILYLIEAGADPNAAAAGGVTPLHRAVRNRARLPSKPSWTPVPMLASKTTAGRPRLTSLTGPPGAVARVHPRPKSNNELFSSCSKSTLREKPISTRTARAWPKQ
jgi:hypothetical protein